MIGWNKQFWYLRLLILLLILSSPIFASITETGTSPNSGTQRNAVALNFYRSLAVAIGSAKGNLEFSFYGGTTVTKVAGTSNIKWIVPTGTKGLVKFEYGTEIDERWEQLTITFSPGPITVLFREGRVDFKRHQLSSIKFRSSGEPLEYFDENNSPIGLALSQFPEVRRHLFVPNGATSLLLGEPFTGLLQTDDSQNTGLNVREVNLLPFEVVNDETTASLKPQSEIVISQMNASGEKNWFRVQSISNFSFNSLSYQKNSSRVIGSLSAFQGSLAEAHFMAGDTNFNLSNRTSFEYDNVIFSTNETVNTETGVSFINGRINGIATADSAITISQTEKGVSKLKLSRSNSLTLENVTLVCSETGVNRISVNNSVLPLEKLSNEIAFDNNNYLQLNFIGTAPNTSISQATWETAQSPRITGQISGFAAEVTKGQFILNKNSTLLLLSGTVQTLGVDINSDTAQFASTKFTEANFQLQSGSSFGVADKFVTNIADGNVSATNADQPLAFESNLDGPQGQLLLSNLTISSGQVDLGSQGQLKIATGDINADVTCNSAAGVSGEMKGAFIIVASSLNLDSHNIYSIRSGDLKFDKMLISDQEGITGSFTSTTLLLAESEIIIPNALTAVFADGAELKSNSNTFVLQIGDDGTLVGHYQLHLPLRGGDLSFGEFGQLLIASGTLDLTYAKEMGKPETVTADLGIAISGGVINPIKGSRIGLLPGSSLNAKAMNVVAGEGISGTVLNADLLLASGVIAIPNGFVIQTKNGGRLTIRQTVKLTKINTSSVPLQGGFDLSLPFSNFYNAEDVTLQFVEGQANLPLENERDGSISGTNCIISGTMNVAISSEATGTINIPIAVSLNNGSLSKLSNEDTANFSADFTATVPQGLEFSVRTKEEDKEGDEFIFAIDIVAKTLESFGWTGKIELNGTGVTIPSLDKRINLIVSIPRTQEVYTDTFCSPLTCTLHLYLLEGTYSATARLQINMSIPSNLELRINELNLTQEVHWERDGCGVCVALADAFNWIKNLFPGEDNPSLSGFIKNKLNEKINNFSISIKRDLRAPSAN